MIVYTWSPIETMGGLNYFLADASNYKSRVYQLDFIAVFLQANVKHRVFVKLYIIYG